MDFCNKCGSIMVPEKKTKHAYLVCRKCGYKTKKAIKSLKITDKPEHDNGIIILEKNTLQLPLTQKRCPKCEHKKSYWWMQQTRAADEPPTQFFKCEKCKYTWREYK